MGDRGGRGKRKSAQGRNGGEESGVQNTRGNLWWVQKAYLHRRNRLEAKRKDKGSPL